MRNIKRPAVIIFAALLMICMIFPAFSETKDEVQQQIDSLESRQAELQDELAALKQNKSDTETYIAQLDEKIEECLAGMSEVTDKIEETDKKIAATEKKLEKARADEKLQYAALKARIKAIYESGDETYLSVLFGQGNLRNLLGDKEYVSKINEYDKNLLVSLKKAGDRIEVYEGDLKSQKEVLEGQKEAYEVEKAALDTVLAQRRSELDELGDEISTMNYDISGIQAKIDAENQRMADILEQEEQARKAAEEAARKEAEAKAAAQAQADEAARKQAEEAAAQAEAERKAAEEAAAQAEAERKAAEEAAAQAEAEKKAAEEAAAQAEAEKKAEEEAAEKAAEEAAAEEQAREEASYATSSDYTGAVLTASAGVVYGPSGKETYYNMDMSGVISIMRGMGFDEDSYPYWVRSDGCKMLGDYIICAANLDTHPRGTTVMSSLGLCLVCDTGGFAYSNPNQLDIATSW